MSLSKPVMKQPRMPKPNPATLQRTETESDLSLSSTTVEEKNRRIAVTRPASSPIHTPSLMTSQDQSVKHPKGHKVRALDEVWKIMDSQDFLHLTDTLALADVWVQPREVVSSKGAFATVSFTEMVAGPHIKFRTASCKISLDDLAKMLYLNDCLQSDVQGAPRYTYEDWLKEKSSICVKAKGMEEGSDRAKLCNFIITEDRTFTFYPSYLHGLCGIFFRKICYHSYSNKTEESKIENPSMLKCKGTKGSFEYIIEARIFPLPYAWFDAADPSATSMVDRCRPDSTDVPESQVP